MNLSDVGARVPLVRRRGGDPPRRPVVLKPYFLKSASSPACAMASSVSDLAPLAAMPPRVLTV